MIGTLLFTVLIESVVGLAYSIRQKKPIVPVLITGVMANLITQSLLWIALNIFFEHYLAALFLAEIFIWLSESALLYGVRSNQLSVNESLLLSLMMNLSSFVLGWLLPV